MTDFKKIDEYIDYVEKNIIPEGMTFNEFAIEFYETTKIIPLSKYLRNKNKLTKLPKIMNMKSAGEFLLDTEKDAHGDIKSFLKRKGHKEIPELNYTMIMLVRKTDLFSNWSKIFIYLGGDKTIEEINNSTKLSLFPEEIEKLENFIKEELKINDSELNSLLSKIKKIENNKMLLRAVKKLNRQ